MPRGHLTPVERGQIEILLKEGYSQADIARKIGRCRSVVCRELKRNGGAKRYRAVHAQQRYDVVRQACVPHKRLEYRPLWNFLFDKLIDNWSPQQVAKSLPVLYPDDPRMRISHETLYMAIYGDKRLAPLIRHLPQARPKRRKRGQGKSRRGPSIPNRVGIEKRPEIVEQRSRFGDWEGDLIVGANNEGFLVTMVDRTSRRLGARLVPSKHADVVAEAVTDILMDMPLSHIHTITFDNGTEFARHEDIAARLPVDIYFASPYSSYQRGTNENTNGLIRRYLPKGTSFKNLTPQQLETIVDEINNRPRKCLQFRTPNEVFRESILNRCVALAP